MPDLPIVDLPRIREHAGAQHRGFEEFAYLLAWDLEGLDRGTEIERRATPDGGIEFSCIPEGVGEGGRWAWQAKYLFRFDRSTFSQMTKSVIAALDNTPDLERYILVLPKDRSDAGIRRWNAAVETWTGEATKRGMRVEFQFRGESQLIAAATQDRHAGALRYFFDQQFLTQKFMKDQVEREVKNLGERYSPEVNVETEARSIIDAACRSPRFTTGLRDLLRSPTFTRPRSRDSADRAELTDESNSIEALLDEWNDHVAIQLERLAEPGDEAFQSLDDGARRFLCGVQEQENAIQERIDTITAAGPTHRPERPPSSDGKKRRPTKAEAAEEQRTKELEALRDFRGSLWRLTRALDNILHYLGGQEGKAAKSGSVLIVGEAGCGKSHLVADLALERTEADMPSLMVLGQHLVEGVVDPQICHHLQLGTTALPDALQALDVAARVRRNGRALLVIDAVNEGAGADLWEDQLPGFVTAVARYPWVALVITIRDVYETSVLPDGVPAEMTRSVHQGLAGHEGEALHLYANLYDLRLPDVPTLLPELANPLFLRSLCQSVRGRGLDAIPRQAASLAWVFDGLVDAVDTTLRHPKKLNYAEWETKVPKAVAALAAAMVDTDSEMLPVSEASAVCQELHAETRNSKSLLHGLIVEGLLLQERVDRDGQRVETIRFTYQRLSDHLRAGVLLERNPTNRELAAAVRALAQLSRPWAMSGVISALVLLTPETRGKELATILRLGAPVTTGAAFGAEPKSWLRNQVQQAFFDTLVWRDPTKFTTTTHELLRRYLEAGVVENYEWLRILSSLACVPDHPLNADWLHPILWKMDLPFRDEVWSRELMWVFSDDVNPVSRTIDWAWAHQDAPEDVARLASTFLAWLLTSPNRQLRDTATKALISVTTNHTQVLTDLARTFATVNDPYVLDRVVAAAYGHILRRRNRAICDLDALRGLAQAVYDAVFDAPEPVTHLLLRDRARRSAQIVDQMCREQGVSLDRDLSHAHPPYGAPWPLTAPTARQLAKGFGRTYDKYLHSAIEVDWDFTDDLERGLLSDLALPDQTRLRTARRRTLAKQLSAALNTLIDGTAESRKNSVRRRAERLISEHNATPTQFWTARTAWNSFESSLPKKSHPAATKLRRISEELDRLDVRTFNPDPDLCTRWIAARILDLGWTKDRFGDADARVERHSHRTPVVERITKKYQRIATQELCGHLLDHCTLAERWGDRPTAYDGPWQLPPTLDIDPSLLARGDRPDEDTPAARLREIRLREETKPAWWRLAREHQLNHEGTDDDWLSDTTDIPVPETLLRALDPKGREWVAVERHQSWELNDEPGPSFRDDKRELWIRSHAILIEAGDADHITWAANRNWMGLRELSTPADKSVGALGEYPDIGGWAYDLDLSDRESRPQPESDPGFDVLPKGWEYAEIGEDHRSPYALTTVSCQLDSERDLSAVDTPGATMPSRVLLDLLDAEWSGGLPDGGSIDLGPLEREYSWISGNQVVAFYEAERGYSGTHVLWVLADHLRTALRANNLVLWAWTLAEKIYWSKGEPSSDRTDCFGAVQLGPCPVETWGYTIERDSGRDRGRAGERTRILAKRPTGLAETPMPTYELPVHVPSAVTEEDTESRRAIEEVLSLYVPTTGDS